MASSSSPMVSRRPAAAARARAPVVDLPPMYPAQERAFFCDARFSFIEGSTKSGKTAGCMLWQIAQVLMRRRGGVHWWVAPVYEQARIAYRRSVVDFAGIYESKSDGRLELIFPGGSAWRFKSGENPDALFGEELESAVIDEASRCREKVWEAVRSTLSTTRGPCRVIGNVKGRGNWHYKLCRRAAMGLPGYHYAKLTAQDAVDGGVLHPDELAQAELDLAHEVYRELYFCEPSDDAYNPFGLDAIARATVDEPLSGAPVVYGLDLARKRDWTVLTGLSATGDVVDFWRVQGGTWADIERGIADRVGRVPVLADATGVGDRLVEELQRLGVAVTPYVFTSSSKQELMQGVRVALSDGLLRIPRGPIISELEAFEYSHTTGGRVSYAAPAGYHDDCVMSLALAVHMGTVLTARVRRAQKRVVAQVAVPPSARTQTRNARRFR